MYLWFSKESVVMGGGASAGICPKKDCDQICKKGSYSLSKFLSLTDHNF